MRLECLDDRLGDERQKVRLTPSDALNDSLAALRRVTILVMSTSRDLRQLSALVQRFAGLRRDETDPVGLLRRSAQRGELGPDLRGGRSTRRRSTRGRSGGSRSRRAGAGSGALAASAAASTSCLRMRPPTPVPLIEFRSRLLSAASLRTSGVTYGVDSMVGGSAFTTVADSVGAGAGVAATGSGSGSGSGAGAGAAGAVPPTRHR